jgi:hypothetical protein
VILHFVRLFVCWWMNHNRFTKLINNYYLDLTS